MRGEQSVVIPAPVDAVYAFVGDFPRHVEWNHQPQKMTQLTEGPVRVGTRFRTEETVASNLNWFMAKVMFPILNMIIGVKAYTEAEITELVQDQRVAWKAEAPSRGGFLMKANWEIDLTAVNEGTQVTQRFHFMPQHWISKRAANDNIAKQIEEEVGRNLARLKSIIANQSPE